VSPLPPLYLYILGLPISPIPLFASLLSAPHLTTCVACTRSPLPKTA
jgi:hypothetical protein